MRICYCSYIAFFELSYNELILPLKLLFTIDDILLGITILTKLVPYHIVNASKQVY